MDKLNKLIKILGIPGSLLLLVIDLSIIFYIDLLRESPIHNLERDIVRDNIYNVCLASLIPLSSLFITCIIIYFIKKHRNNGQEAKQVDSTSISTDIIEPTLEKTSIGNRSRKPVKISENFDNLFLPIFNSNDELKRNGLLILKEQLEARSWSKTELGRIANMIFEANILVSQYNSEFTVWLPAFFEALGREEDIPKKINKNAYSVGEQDELKKHFNYLVKIGENRNKNYHQNIN